MAKKIYGGREFKIAQAAIDEVNRIIDQYATGVPITDAAEHDLLLAVLSDHYDAAARIGDGVEFFARGDTKDLQDGLPGRGVKHKRVNDSNWVHWSYVDVIEGRQKPKDQAIRAMDGAVKEIRDAYKARRLSTPPVICDFTGESLKGAPRVDVFYVDPQKGPLMHAFMRTIGSWDDIENEAAPGMGRLMTNSQQRSNWVAFFQKHAVLGISKPSAHLRRTKVPEDSFTPSP